MANKILKLSKSSVLFFISSIVFGAHRKSNCAGFNKHFCRHHHGRHGILIGPVGGDRHLDVSVPASPEKPLNRKLLVNVRAIATNGHTARQPNRFAE